MKTENEVQAALDNERHAFTRKQAAFFRLLPSRSLRGNRPSATRDSDVAENEALAAEADWKAKDAEFRRIVDESLTGRHH
ncbi:hypothetical protein [Rhodanobacter sp. C05]|uniref:hypothetical protein n=1 Tax=Rhodanobacter sp. C05 TaxID=1945855 RepID=UPI000985D6EA|nr:hypothetical protein [Rhodanobacter sp. C05]OOG38600.1 hypothetical protein B0E51_13720 [Rhodanobacter sp. C05]